MLLHPRSLVAILVLLSWPTLPASAQEERWYEVELLIFSQPGSNASEQWDALPELTYPTTSRFLVDNRQVAARRAGHEGESELDEFGRLWLRPPQEVPDIPDAATATGVAPLRQDSPTPFVSLPRRDSAFYGKAAYMQRSGGYRTLFHERWVQPVRGEKTAVPLIVDRSGDSGDWPLLQGSVKIHISRYLHLETNLWLNTRGEYFPDNAWRMPAPPMGPPSVIEEQPETLVDEDPYFVSAPPPPEDALDPNDPTLVATELGPQSPWRHAVLLQQKRRMRSNEVHYIDHPLLGVVIQFTPVDDARRQAMANAEFTAGASPN